MDENRLVITTGNEVVGTEIIEYLGIVRGIGVRATGIGQGIIGGIEIDRRREHRGVYA